MESRSYQSNNTKYKFTGKERDNENNYDYFGARYYDSRIGRWGGVDQSIYKYVQWSPYNYGICNPIVIVDFDGRDLYLGGDQEKSLKYIQEMLPTDLQSRVTASDKGKVSFDITGLDLESDEAYNLLNDLITSSEQFLFEVTDNTTVVRRYTLDKERPAGETVNLDLTSKPGYENASVTPREEGKSGAGLLPKTGFHGQVSLGTGYWTKPNSDEKVPISNFIFHELTENLYRTKYSMSYQEAHQKANELSKNFAKQEGPPGEYGHYVYKK